MKNKIVIVGHDFSDPGYIFYTVPTSIFCIDKYPKNGKIVCKRCGCVVEFIDNETLVTGPYHCTYNRLS